jgi:hypothetical protein
MSEGVKHFTIVKPLILMALYLSISLLEKKTIQTMSEEQSI